MKNKITKEEAKLIVENIDKYRYYCWQRLFMHQRNTISVNDADENEIKVIVADLLKEIKKQFKNILLNKEISKKDYKYLIKIKDQWLQFFIDIEKYVKEREKYDNDKYTTDLTSKENAMLFSFVIENKILKYHRESQSDIRAKVHLANSEDIADLRDKLKNNDISLDEFIDQAKLLERLYSMNGRSYYDYDEYYEEYDEEYNDEEGCRVTFEDLDRYQETGKM